MLCMFSRKQRLTQPRISQQSTSKILAPKLWEQTTAEFQNHARIILISFFPYFWSRKSRLHSIMNLKSRHRSSSCFTYVYFSRETIFYACILFVSRNLAQCQLPLFTSVFDLVWLINRYNTMSPVLKPKYTIIMFNVQEEPIPENLNHVMTDVEVAQSVEQAIAALDIVSCQILQLLW